MRKPRADTVAWFTRSALRSITNEHARHQRLETGGVLFGYWSGSDEVVVTDATGAGPRARHAAAAYEPDTAHDATEIARLYEASGRLHTYLGDWHSHPSGDVHLSRRDRRTLRDIARYDEARAPTPLMAVLGKADDTLAIGVWVTRQRRVRLALRSCRIRVFGP